MSRPSVKAWTDRLHAGLVQDLRQRDRVLLVRVHAAGRHQAEQVAGAARRLQLRDQVRERRRAGEAAVLGGVADARQFLHHHAPGADVQMTDLGIAHLAVRQPDVAAGGVQEGVRAALPQPVEVRLARLTDRVVGGFLAPAEAVEDHQHHRPNRLRHGSAPIASRALGSAGTMSEQGRSADAVHGGAPMRSRSCLLHRVPVHPRFGQVTQKEERNHGGQGQARRLSHRHAVSGRGRSGQADRLPRRGVRRRARWSGLPHPAAASAMPRCGSAIRS